jgi:Cys-tRNA(Pro)/Cys-tRNA(Cys) deacylase
VADERIRGRQITLGAGEHGAAIAAAADDLIKMLGAAAADVTDPES